MVQTTELCTNIEILKKFHRFLSERFKFKNRILQISPTTEGLEGRFSIATYGRPSRVEWNRKRPNRSSQFREIEVTFFGQFPSEFIGIPRRGSQKASRKREKTCSFPVRADCNVNTGGSVCHVLIALTSAIRVGGVS